MSASEQEIKSQVTEMREALRSAAASRRAARVVNIVAVLVGFCIVGFIVWSILELRRPFIAMAKHPEELQEAVMAQLRPLQLDQKAMKALQEAAPAYLDEGRKMVQDLKLPEVALQQVRELMRELEPAFRVELERIRPRVTAMLDNQRQALLDDLEKLLSQKLNQRLAGIIGEQGGRLSADTGLDEAAIERIIVDLQDASVEAFKGMLEKREGTLLEEMDRFMQLLAQIPPMPETTQAAVLEELGLVLVTLLKYQLPEYEVPLTTITAVPPSAAPAALPAVAPTPLPAAIPAEMREKIEERRRRGLEAGEEARERAPVAPPEAGVAAPAPELPAEAREAMERGREAAEAAKAKGAEQPGEFPAAAPPAEVREKIEEGRKRAEEARKEAEEEGAR